MYTIQTLLAQAVLQLFRLESPQMEAERLLAVVLKKPQSFLYTYPEKMIADDHSQNFFKLIKRRADGEPFSYVVGEQPFHHLDLKVTRDVLIPRPATENLVEKILDFFPKNESLSIIELGTGSGAIGLTLAHERSAWDVLASDVSNAALMVARENQRCLKIENIKFILSDWYQNIPKRKVDIIVSNPPYIALGDPAVAKDVFEHEPHLALFADENGFAAHRIIVEHVKEYLKKEGMIFLEHGYQQGAAIRDLLQENDFNAIKTYPDLSGHERITVGKMSG
jgi:release factor glutamine methyltransferase